MLFYKPFNLTCRPIFVFIFTPFHFGHFTAPWAPFPGWILSYKSHTLGLGLISYSVKCPENIGTSKVCALYWDGAPKQIHMQFHWGPTLSGLRMLDPLLCQWPPINTNINFWLTCLGEQISRHFKQF